MARSNRFDVGGYVYHVVNRGVGKQRLFFEDSDYLAFEQILAEARRATWMRILAYCLMPNHWHLILWPLLNGDLSEFMHRLTTTHVARWHAHRKTVGTGHLYQGRFKSFVCQTDAHYFTLCRYVERNARRANLVEAADQWRFSSLWRTEYGSSFDRALLSDWPIPRPADWAEKVNVALTGPELKAIRDCSKRELPYGDDRFIAHAIDRFGLKPRFDAPGRPRIRTT